MIRINDDDGTVTVPHFLTQSSMTEQEEILHEKFELIQAFAQDRRLKISKTDEGEKVIAGRRGESHIYQYSLTELAVAFVPNKWTPKTLGKSQAGSYCSRDDASAERRQRRHAEFRPGEPASEHAGSSNR